jgi:hypothetical protein
VALNPALLAAIQTQVASLATAYQNAASNADLYEAYTLSIVADGARSEGGTVSILDNAGNPATTLLLRSGPSDIFTTTQAFTHLRIAFPSVPPLEVHVGIYVGGRSGVKHECDVVVLPQNEAEACRLNQVVPKHSSLIFAVECKYYASGLGLNLARSFIGLSSEILRSDTCFVSNIQADSVDKVFEQHKRKWEPNMEPGHPTEVGRFRHLAQDCLKRYKVRR